MKFTVKLMISLSLQAVILLPLSAHAAKKAHAHKPVANRYAVDSKGPRDSLSRDIRFGDSAVYGKYQYANEGTAEVENEKTLDDLLGVRTDFKDRLKLETRRH